MDVLWLLLALILLVLPGLQLAWLVIPRGVSGRPALVAGYGLLAALLGVPLLIRLVDFLGIPVSFVYTAGAVSLTVATLLVIKLWLGDRPPAQPDRVLESAPLDSWDKVLVALLLAVITLRAGNLGIELIWRPLFPFDATMHWATKARVWFEHYELMPFVENRQWLESAHAGVYTDHHPGYPITIPLLQLWITSALGQWNESLMNLPWLVCFAGLGFAFYGQSRHAGVGVVLSLVFTYFLLSLPLLNTHVALAGYADFFLGACYCLAIMAFYNWSVERQAWQAVLAVVFALCCTLLKNEGLFWLMTFLPALAVVLLPRRYAIWLLAMILVAVVLLLFLFPRDMVIAGHSLEQLNLHYRAGAARAIFESLFFHGSWHLFAYLLLGLLMLVPLMARPEIKRFAGLVTALASAAALFLFLFIFTRYAFGAIHFTAVGRISLQLVPSLMFLCVLLCHALFLNAQKGERWNQRGTQTAKTGDTSEY